MNRRLASLLFFLGFLGAASALMAQVPPPDATSSATASAQAAQNTNAAAAAQYLSHQPRTPGFLEHLVDDVLDAFHVPHNGNTTPHFVLSFGILVGTLLLRRVLTGYIFKWLERLAARTSSTLDDRLLPALEKPVLAFVTLLGFFTAIKVLKLSESLDLAVGTVSTIAFSAITFWALLRALDAILDHAQLAAKKRGLGIVAFMPWIKKTLITLVAVLGVLITASSLGFQVQPFLQGLGIGGLAFALAAQDTIANIFGALVVAVDQPFILGDAVKIGSSEGVVEDIGLRSTRLRTVGKNLIVIPNKTVAGEAIINNSRFTQRRIEQLIGLTYDAKVEQLEGVVNDIRELLQADAAVDPASVMVYFRDYNASSLDIWVVYNSKSPDFRQHLELRQRINFAMMRIVEKRELAFAFPTQTMHFDGPVAKQLIGQAGGLPVAPRNSAATQATAANAVPTPS